MRKKIGSGIGIVALALLSACATGGSPEQAVDGAVQCKPTETKTCDRFNGENYNCSCQRGTSLRDMLDAYQMQ